MEFYWRFSNTRSRVWHKDKLKVMEDIMINNPQIKVLTTNVTNLYDNSKREQSSGPKRKIRKSFMDKTYIQS